MDYHNKTRLAEIKPGEPDDLREFYIIWRGRKVYVSIYEHEMVQYLIEKATRPSRNKTRGSAGQVATLQGTVILTIEGENGKTGMPTVRTKFRNTIRAAKA